MLTAREVRTKITGRCDPQVMYCIEALAEQNSVLRQQLMELAMQQNGLIDLIGNFGVVAENMKDAINSMKGIDPDDGGEAVTR